MQRFLFLCACLLACVSARAQQPRLKLDALGLPPYPGGEAVGQISLPLAGILAPKPGETPTGPKLSDLSITSYRTPLSTPVPQIAAFYRKYATEAGWKLLDDIPENADKRSLVFYSAAAPGYLTVDITFSPDNKMRQIDLTRLLGDVDPNRPGELLKLTGKRVRRQQVAATFSGRFLDIRSNKFVRTAPAAVEETSESGLGPADARWIAPVGETYQVTLNITDGTKMMTRAQVYAGNGDKIAEVVSEDPVGALHVTAAVRGSQAPSLRVLIQGRPEPVREDTPTPPLTPAPVEPPREVILSEWPGVRPPRTAMIEVRRGAVSTRTEPIPGPEVDAGSSCDGAIQKTVGWTGETSDAFDFSTDFFGPGFPRAQIGTREGSIKVDFPKGSGTANLYSLSQTRAITETQIQVGYSFGGQWLRLPSKRPNPVKTVYRTITVSPPVAKRRSEGSCDAPAPDPSTPAAEAP